MGRQFLSLPYEPAPDATTVLLSSVGLSKWSPGPDAFDPDSDEFFADAVWEVILTGDALKEHQDTQRTLERNRVMEHEMEREREWQSELMSSFHSERRRRLPGATRDRYDTRWWDPSDDGPIAAPDQLDMSDPPVTAHSSVQHSTERLPESRPSDSWELVHAPPTPLPSHVIPPPPVSDTTLASIHLRRAPTSAPRTAEHPVVLDRDGDAISSPSRIAIYPIPAASPVESPTTPSPVTRFPRWYSSLRNHIAPASTASRVFVNDEPYSSQPFFSFSSPTSPTEDTFRPVEVASGVPFTPLR
jgi:hypothetical protein